MTSPRKPLIGVTGPDRDHWPSWFFIWLGLRRAGACVVRLRPNKPRYDLKLDGLVISGGTDVDPERYGKDRKINYVYDHARDELERTWFTVARQHKLPVLGICRGAQLMNVTLGGSLYMDIKLVCETARYPGNFLSQMFFRKSVIVKQGSQMQAMLGTQLARVNSLHRQSLEEIGSGLTVTAWEENTIVQAVEGSAHETFMIGVQWHPEFMPFSNSQQNIFRQLVAHAKEHVVTA